MYKQGAYLSFAYYYNEPNVQCKEYRLKHVLIFRYDITNLRHTNAAGWISNRIQFLFHKSLVTQKYVIELKHHLALDLAGCTTLLH